MSNPLSVDLRKRVIEAIDEGFHVDVVVKRFKVSRRSVYTWLERRRQAGSIEPKINYQKGHSHKIKNFDEFKKFVEPNKHCTVKEMVAKWEEINNESISESSIERALKKISYTSKKNFQLCGSKAR